MDVDVRVGISNWTRPGRDTAYTMTSDALNSLCRTAVSLTMYRKRKALLAKSRQIEKDQHGKQKETCIGLPLLIYFAHLVSFVSQLAISFAHDMTLSDNLKPPAYSSLAIPSSPPPPRINSITHLLTHYATCSLNLPASAPSPSSPTT